MKDLPFPLFEINQMKLLDIPRNKILNTYLELLMSLASLACLALTLASPDELFCDALEFLMIGMCGEESSWQSLLEADSVR